MKFGGASVETTEHFARLADLIHEKKKSVDQLVVVVSAMGSTTEHLLKLCREVHDEPPRREQDMLVSVGERISSALLAMALNKRGIDAISLTGSQAGIITSTRHSDAQIVDVRPWRICKYLELGKVVIVAGFQGVSLDGEITTLGRGGSDTTAVALAIALDARCVEFYKDVDGIYSEDPKKNRDAVHFSSLSYDEALAIVKKGAKILHPRSIELAKKNLIELNILSFKKSSHNAFMGTIISADQKMRGDGKLYEILEEEEQIC